MNKTIIISILGLFALGLGACNKVDYQGVYNSDGYYTRHNEAYWLLQYKYDSTQLHSFGLELPSVTSRTIELPVRILGKPHSTPLHLKVIADEASTAVAGEHYQPLPEYIEIPVGVYETKVEVTLLRGSLPARDRESLSNEELAQASKKLILRLDPSEDLKVSINQQQRLHIEVNNLISKPRWWDIFAYPFALGEYHHEKYTALLSYYDTNPADLVKDMLGLSTEVFNSYQRTYSIEGKATIVQGNNTRWLHNRSLAFTALYNSDPAKWQGLISEASRRSPYQ